MITKKFNKGDFPRVYRPDKISEVYGQEEIKKIIGNGLDSGTLAHTLLFHGISGTGKTTIARIIAMGLNCQTNNPTSEPCGECDSCRRVLSDSHFAFLEFNAAHFRGIDHIKRIIQDFDAYPLGQHPCRVVIFDEAHRLTKDAQNVLLKGVEDADPMNHFIFCSTEPEAIIETLRNRCMHIEFENVADDEIKGLLIDVCRQEEIVVNSDVLDRIIREADGMPRNALFGLQKAIAAEEMERVSAVFENKMEMGLSELEMSR